MHKPWINRLLDTILFLCGAGLVLTGTLQEWILPGGPEQRGLTWLGWTRHDWAELHSVLAWTAAAGVALHLALHWSWIKAFLFGQPPRRSGWILLGLALLLLGGALGLPFAVPTERRFEVALGQGPGLEKGEERGWRLGGGPGGGQGWRGGR